MYEFIYTMTDEERTSRASIYPQIKAEIYYSLGGYNWFHRCPVRRGYKVMVTPCEVFPNGTRRFTLLSESWESGRAFHLEDATRLNRRRLAAIYSAFDLERFATLYAGNDLAAMQEMVVGVTHTTNQ